MGLSLILVLVRVLPSLLPTSFEDDGLEDPISLALDLASPPSYPWRRRACHTTRQRGTSRGTSRIARIWVSGSLLPQKSPERDQLLVQASNSVVVSLASVLRVPGKGSEVLCGSTCQNGS